MTSKNILHTVSWAHKKHTQTLKFDPTPVDMIKVISGRKYKVPLYSSKVQAGFPSPADDYIEKYLDLNMHFIKHPAATFVLQATGDSMIDAGIRSGDWLLVDKSIEPTDGKIVIAAVNGELTVKYLSRVNGRLQLVPANSDFQPIDITEDYELIIWGVVTVVMHELP